MSAEARQARKIEVPALQVIDGGRAARKPGPRRVVAEVLSDGTVLPVVDGERETDRGFAVGRLSGDGWTLWWERRDW